MNHAQKVIMDMYNHSGDPHANGNQQGAAAHANLVNQPGSADLLRKIRSDEAIPCYGGYLFRREDSIHGSVLCFAVENMTPDDIQAAEKWYSLCGRMSHLGIIHRTASNPIPVENYTVFEFDGPQDPTLAERCRSGAPFRQDCNMTMYTLVCFLYRYRNELMKMRGSEYLPLNCLSKETIILDSEGTIRLLPLRAAGNNYPLEIPREVSAGESGDERSDLYAAAFVSVEIHSFGRANRDLLEPESDLISKCLKPIQDWRPSLDDVYQACVNNEPVADRHRTPEGYTDSINWGKKLRDMFGSVSTTCQKLLSSLKHEESEFQTDATQKHASGYRPMENIHLDDSHNPNSTFHR